MPANRPFSIQARAGSRSAEVFIYGDIGESWDGESVAARDFVRDLAALEADRLVVRLNSYGGSVTDGLAIYNALKRHPAEVETEIDGIAASIASLIAMAGQPRSVAANAMLMVHAPWGFALGNSVEMRGMADVLDKYAEAMASAYVDASGLAHDDVMALLTDGKDHWYGADEAIQAGFADRMSEAVPIAARFRRQIAQRYPTFTAAAAAQLRGDSPMPKPNPPSAGNPPPAASDPNNPTGEGGSNPPSAPPVGATGRSPLPTPPEPAPAAGNPPLDPEQIRAEAIRAETKRRSDIKAKFQGPFLAWEGVPELMDACLDDPNCDARTAGERLLAHLAKDAEPIQGRHFSAGLDARDKFKLGAGASLRARAGLLTPDDRNDLKGNQFRGYTLKELARAALEMGGEQTGHLSKMDLVAAAFTHTTSDFPSLLMDVAEKSMLKGYEEAEETFQLWTSRGELPDFKPANRVGLENFPALVQVDEGAEYTYATVGERKETIQLATYGRMFSITRQAIINDDLQAFTTIPRKMGNAAIRTVGNLVYAVLTSNPVMSDGVALFHANHGNLLSAAAITTASVDALRVAMATQQDAVGANLNIGLRYLIVPKALEGTARVVRDSQYEVGASSRNNTVPNMVRGTFEIVSDARLDADSATAWYAAANQVIHDVIEVAYLDGQDRPYLDQQMGWTVDGTEFKVRIDAGVKALEWRTLAKNPGA
ncbi:ClpP-like prohead protease/major capsid protein fusion protein [Methylohalobius crimeensis]|uniref:ClpP-like prohead protease/major capsid protein fusion protein n=1 Tax=Methylohalobius crimeensis TaxID=244365 RepID=UPI0003B48497|nr:ClpP-like prohead protease/major capsid protein fusion protein [Methylohalobius crimeensis]